MIYIWNQLFWHDWGSVLVNAVKYLRAGFDFTGENGGEGVVTNDYYKAWLDTVHEKESWNNLIQFSIIICLVPCVPKLCRGTASRAQLPRKITALSVTSDTARRVPTEICLVPCVPLGMPF